MTSESNLISYLKSKWRGKRQKLLILNDVRYATKDITSKLDNSWYENTFKKKSFIVTDMNVERCYFEKVTSLSIIFSTPRAIKFLPFKTCKWSLLLHIWRSEQDTSRKYVPISDSSQFFIDNTCSCSSVSCIVPLYLSNVVSITWFPLSVSLIHVTWRTSEQFPKRAVISAFSPMK